MKQLSEEIVRFLENQGVVILSTIEKDGSVRNVCKGIVNIKKKGKIYLIDLYKGATYDNMRRNPKISLTAVDEHKFIGWCLKGKARLVEREKVRNEIIKAWEYRIVSRITRRILKNLREERGHPKHPEALLPKPQYMIAVTVNEIIDLTPHHLKEMEVK